MITRGDHKLWQDFEREQIASETPDYQRNLHYFAALYREALLLGVLPTADPLAGLEVDIRLAAILAKLRVHRTS